LGLSIRQLAQMTPSNIPEDLQDIDARLRNEGADAMSDERFTFSEDDTQQFFFRLRAQKEKPSKLGTYRQNLIPFLVGAIAACFAFAIVLQLQKSEYREQYRGGATTEPSSEEIEYIVEGAFIALPPEFSAELEDILRQYHASEQTNTSTAVYNELITAISKYLSLYASSKAGEPAWNAAEAFLEIEQALAALKGEFSKADSP